MSKSKPAALRVALLGCGVVGSQIVRLLNEQTNDLTARIGVPLELVGVAVRRPARHNDVPQELITTDAEALVARDDVDIVVRDAWLPGDIASGDLIAVAATGAYCRSMASNYNHVPRPPVVSVRDGIDTVIVRRETEEDLLSLDTGVAGSTT